MYVLMFYWSINQEVKIRRRLTFLVDFGAYSRGNASTSHRMPDGGETHWRQIERGWQGTKVMNFICFNSGCFRGEVKAQYTLQYSTTPSPSNLSVRSGWKTIDCFSLHHPSSIRAMHLVGRKARSSASHVRSHNSFLSTLATFSSLLLSLSHEGEADSSRVCNVLRRPAALDDVHLGRRSGCRSTAVVASAPRRLRPSPSSLTGPVGRARRGARHRTLHFRRLKARLASIRV